MSSFHKFNFSENFAHIYSIWQVLSSEVFRTNKQMFSIPLSLSACVSLCALFWGCSFGYQVERTLQLKLLIEFSISLSKSLFVFETNLECVSNNFVPCCWQKQALNKQTSEYVATKCKAARNNITFYSCKVQRQFVWIDSSLLPHSFDFFPSPPSRRCLSCLEFSSSRWKQCEHKHTHKCDRVSLFGGRRSWEGNVWRKTNNGQTYRSILCIINEVDDITTVQLFRNAHRWKCQHTKPIRLDNMVLRCLQ